MHILHRRSVDNADLTVHRALVAACGLGEGGQTAREAEKLHNIAEEISTLERRAMLAERESSDRYLSDYLSDQVGAVFDARIRGITRFGAFVMLTETGADGFLPMRNLPGRGWRFDEDQSSLIAYGGKRRLVIGQAVQVRLIEAAPIEGGLIVDLIVSDEQPMDHHPKRNKGRKTEPKSRKPITKRRSKSARRKGKPKA